MSHIEAADVGHAEQVARGRVEYPNDRLGTVMRRCKHLLEATTRRSEKPKTELQAR